MPAPSDTIDEPLLTALGRLVYTWAFVEAMEGEFLAFLLNAHQGLAHVITQKVSGSTITDWLRTLASIRFEAPDVQRIGALMARIDEVRGDRNAYVHGLWAPGPVEGTALVTTIRWDRAEVMKRELATLNDLEEVTREALELYAEICVIGRHLGFAGPHNTTQPPIA